MKNILAKTLHGFLFGIGIMAAFIGSTYAYSYLYFGKNIYSGDEMFEIGGYDENSGLVIKDQHERKTEKGVVVLGTIENTGDKSWNYIVLEAEIYDEDGVFIDECMTHLSKKLSSKESDNFKITCGGGCQGNEISNYGKIVVSISDANFAHD